MIDRKPKGIGQPIPFILFYSRDWKPLVSDLYNRIVETVEKSDSDQGKFVCSINDKKECVFVITICAIEVSNDSNM